MKEQFKEIRFSAASETMIDLCNRIISRYSAQGLKLTLRQLYYQLVTVNAIPNREQSYKNLGSLVSNARLAGRMDWNAIEDRVRVPRIPSEFEDIQDLVNVALQSYRLPRWAGQPEYVELWVEKDAISGVLQPLARSYHVTLMVNRGYSSQSAMYEAAGRFIANSVHKANLPAKTTIETLQRNHRECCLLYLGDLDPSGEDMVRDIQERLDLMCERNLVNVQKIALTPEQVAQYNPPPNPAKHTDSRASGYIAKHGESSWEVDALPPDVLQQLVGKAIRAHLDKELMDAIVQKEEADKKRLQEAARDIR